jgi:hypothetical protein
VAEIVVTDDAPVQDTITIYQGATFQKSWEYGENPDNSGMAPPAPNWPSEWLARLEIRAGFKKTVECRFHSEDNTADGLISLGTSTDGEAGTITIHLSAAKSTAMTWTKGIWDLELEHKPSGRVVRVLFGGAIMSREVTILD